MGKFESLEGMPVDRNERRQRNHSRHQWVAVLALLPWLSLIGGGISMCVLYKPGERIGTVGYCILAVMLAPVLITIPLCLWRRYLDLDCMWCGRPFFSTDLPKLLQTGRCPGCGQTVPAEDLEDYR